MYCISSGIVLSHSKVTVDICSKLEGFQLVTAQRYFTPTQRSNFPTENFRSPPWKKKKESVLLWSTKKLLPRKATMVRP